MSCSGGGKLGVYAQREARLCHTVQAGQAERITCCNAPVKQGGISLAKCIIHHISKKILDAVVVCHLKKFFWRKGLLWCKGRPSFTRVQGTLYSGTYTNTCRLHAVPQARCRHQAAFQHAFRAYASKWPGPLFPLCANVQHIALCGGVDDECSDRDAYSRGQPALCGGMGKGAAILDAEENGGHYPPN